MAVLSVAGPRAWSDSALGGMGLLWSEVLLTEAGKHMWALLGGRVPALMGAKVLSGSDS